MKKVSKPVLIWSAVGLLVVAVLIALFVFIDNKVEKPVEIQSVETPVSEVQQSVKVSPPNKMENGEEFRTGWTQVENGVEFSLSGSEGCTPEVEKATKKGSELFVWLKESPDDCSNTVGTLAYTTLEGVKGIERFWVYESGYPEPFELHEK